MKLFFNATFFSITLSIFALCCSCSINNAKTQATKTYQVKIGDYILWSINDSERQAATDIFQHPAVLEKLKDSELDKSEIEEKEKVLKEIQETYPDGTYTGTINFFVLKTPKKNFLIDAGLSNLKEKLLGLGLEPKDIDTALITHVHPDHIKGLIDHQKAVLPNANILISLQESKYLNNLDDTDKNKAAYLELCQAYGSRISTFTNDGSEIEPGILPIAIPGHTPGHTAYKVTSKNKSVLLLGDIFHSIDLQLKNRDICVVYDYKPYTAASVRKDTLDLLEQEPDMLCAGAHITFPGIGKITKDAKGIYKFVPQQ